MIATLENTGLITFKSHKIMKLLHDAKGGLTEVKLVETLADSQYDNVHKLRAFLTQFVQYKITFTIGNGKSKRWFLTAQWPFSHRPTNSSLTVYEIIVYCDDNTDKPFRRLVDRNDVIKAVEAHCTMVRLRVPVIVCFSNFLSRNFNLIRYFFPCFFRLSVEGVQR